MSDNTPNTFGNIPYLALPTIALIVIVIGVGIATKGRIDMNDKAKPTPTPMIVVPSNCQVIQEETLFIVMQCTKSTNYKY